MTASVCDSESLNHQLNARLGIDGLPLATAKSMTLAPMPLSGWRRINRRAVLETPILLTILLNWKPAEEGEGDGGQALPLFAALLLGEGSAPAGEDSLPAPLGALCERSSRDWPNRRVWATLAVIGKADMLKPFTCTRLGPYSSPPSPNQSPLLN